MESDLADLESQLRSAVEAEDYKAKLISEGRRIGDMETKRNTTFLNFSCSSSMFFYQSLDLVSCICAAKSADTPYCVMLAR